MRALQEAQRSNDHGRVFTVSIDNNVNKWKVKLLFNDKDERHFLQALQQKGYNDIELELTFGPEYPSKAPFVRCIYPIFQQWTAHITLGGAVCHPLLFSPGWQSTIPISTLIQVIRLNILEGNPQLHPNQNLGQYNMSTAQQARTRAARQHGWHT
ncbi:hypothetical protein P9112_003342 [Eukaryota sp. TZLM1-RC]